MEKNIKVMQENINAKLFSKDDLYYCSFMIAQTKT